MADDRPPSGTSPPPPDGTSPDGAATPASPGTTSAPASSPAPATPPGSAHAAPPDVAPPTRSAEGAPLPSHLPEPPPALAAAFALFQRGDYKAAKAGVAAVLAGKPGVEVERAAADLMARMAPDPWALRVGIGAAIVLGVVMALWVF